MIPIECPDCHSSNWTYINKLVRQKMSLIREDTDIQVDFDIVKAQCSDCELLFWVPESQAMEHVETFL